MLRHNGQCGPRNYNKDGVFTSWYILTKTLMYIQFLWFPIGFQYEAAAAAAAAKSPQSCTTLCDPIDSSPPGNPVPGILQARTLEWVAISFSNAWKWKVKMNALSRIRLCVTP